MLEEFLDGLETPLGLMRLDFNHLKRRFVVDWVG
jgi:hypothetical protein